MDATYGPISKRILLSPKLTEFYPLKRLCVVYRRAVRHSNDQPPQKQAMRHIMATKLQTNKMFEVKSLVLDMIFKLVLDS